MTDPVLFDIIARAEHLHTAGELEQAAGLYRQALALAPGLSRTAYNLGMLLNELQDYPGAEAAFRQSLASEPDLHEARLNLAFALQEQGKIDQAAEELAQLAMLRPDCPTTRFNLACLRLLSGDLAQGWSGYELRFQTIDPVPLRHQDIPVWGGVIIPGLRLLVHVEQGYGDAIQMARYIPLLHNRGIQVHLEVTGPLLQLFSQLPCASCLLRGSPLPQVDCQIPIMSLPGLFETELESIPAETPYLSADAEPARQWRYRLPDTAMLRVGLCWSGRFDLPVNRKRSCPPEYLKPLFSCPDVDFISLQKDAPDGFACSDSRLHDFTGKLCDFHQTAALISNLDLVITIDTAVAHLAGAMGIPTWLLLPAVPDWRWLRERNDSPWYPSMRLFRQPVPGNWQTVVENVTSALHELLALRLYHYRPDADFSSAMTAARPIPLVESPVSAENRVTPEDADFFVFPYYLEHITEFYGIEQMWSLISSLPHFSGYPEKHLFFSDHDSNVPYHSSSVWFRASTSDSAIDPQAFPLPYHVNIPDGYICANTSTIRYHTCFVGYLGVLRERAPLINGVIAEPRLVHELDLTTTFHHHQPVEVKDARREKYLRTVAQSITVLCPRGDGSNSIRFFETLAMGRIPVLYPPTRLPFEDRIAYDRFVITIPEGCAADSGRIIYEWLSRLPNDELLGRMTEARQAWERHLSLQGMRNNILSRLLRIKLQRSGASPAEMNRVVSNGAAAALDNGLESLQNGDLPHAREHLSAAVRDNPRCSRVYLALGMLELANGNLSESKQQLMHAIGYDHRCHDAYLLLGRIATAEADLPGAVGRYYQASLLRPDMREPYLESLPLLEKLGRHDEAGFCRQQLERIAAVREGTA